MVIPLFHNLRIRAKLITVTIILVLLPLICVAVLSMIRFSQALRTASEQDLGHLVTNIYSMCKVQDEIFRIKGVSALNISSEQFG
jgi:hypothetical protein